MSTGRRGRIGRARVWVHDGPSFRFPEQRLGRPPTGVCFSGGGTRSFAATVGQLRGLTTLGLLPRIGYVSAVSGGAWAAAAHAFYAGPGRTDDDVLGTVVEPEAITDRVLGPVDPGYLGVAATRDFQRTLVALDADPNVPRDRVWVDAVGRTFLQPFGLFEARHPGFTLDAATRDAIVARNPDLASGPMHLVRKGAAHPYLLVHATLNWPADGSREPHKVAFEYSPLAVGAPTLTTLEAAGRRRRIGGGFIEPFAFGCRAPAAAPGTDGVATVELPESGLTLADAIGASSAFRVSGRDFENYPHARCWPVTGRGGEPTAAEVLTDGGDLENYGLIALLRRRVTRVVVFINTEWPLSAALGVSAWPDDSDPEHRAIDPFLAPLFGAPSNRFPHNRVFPEAEFATLVRGLQAARRAGRSVATTLTHRVLANDRWGVSGGWETRICWVYNERVPEWQARIPADVRRQVEAGQAARAEGGFAHFPHYRTRGQNPGCLIRLTPEQVNLLAHLACWTVMANADTLRALLEP